MSSFRSEPILWIHVAGSVVPIFLELCLLGLAVSDPLLPAWLELFIVAAMAGALMQLAALTSSPF